MSTRFSFALAAALAAALTIAIAAPVVRHLSTRTFGAELVGRHHDPFTVMQQYGEGRVPAPYLQPATDLGGMFLGRLAGGVAAYNLVVLVAFPLTVLTAYAHARHLLGPGAGAIVAAVLFAFSPFHVAQAAYHVHIAQIQWIPLFFLALWRLLDQPSPGRVAAAVAAFLLVTAASFYLGFISAVIAPVAAIAYWWWRPAGGVRSLSALAGPLGALVMAAMVLALCLWIAAPDVLLHRARFGFPQDALAPHSARWWSYVAPPLAHPWLAGLTPARWRLSGEEAPLEQQLSLGWSVIALAVVPVITWCSGNRGRASAVVPALLTIAAVALLCSLPALAIGPIRLPAPSQLLYAAAPMFRAYARFGVIVSLVMTTLAGAGVSLLIETRHAAAVAGAAALILMAALEYAPPLPLSRDVLPTAGHRWIANHTGPEARVLDCIKPTPGSSAGVTWLMHRGVGWLGGPFDDCGEPDLGAKLAGFGFSHLLVRSRSSEATWVAAATPDGMRLAARFDDAWVFDVVAPRPALLVTGVSGFFPREYLGADSWRWMAANGSLTVMNATRTPVIASLDVELESFAVERRIAVRFDGVEVGALRVGSRLEWYRTPAVGIAPGPHVLSWTPDVPPTPARAATVTSDRRTLSVALHRWRWRVPGTAPSGS